MEPTSTTGQMMEFMHTEDMSFDEYIKIDNHEIPIEEVTPVLSPDSHQEE